MFGWFRKKPEEELPDIYDPDEVDELVADSMLYTDAQPLKSVSFSVAPDDIFTLDTNALLENIRELPFDLRTYYDMRKTFSRGREQLIEEVGFLDSYEGGRSAEYRKSFEFDDKTVDVTLTLSKQSDNANFVLAADIKVY